MSDCIFAHAFFGILLEGEELRQATVQFREQAKDNDLTRESDDFDDDTVLPDFPAAYVAKLNKKYEIKGAGLVYVDEDRYMENSSGTVEGGSILLGYGVLSLPGYCSKIKKLKAMVAEADWHLWVEGSV